MAFDSAVISFTTKTDKVDLVQAAHMNAVQAELVTIETILGTNVKGDRENLKTRLNNVLDADGSILSGTAFPSPAYPSQLFYRTDLELLYISNSINAGWNLATGAASVAGPYPGNTTGVLDAWTCATERTRNGTPYAKVKEIMIPRAGTLRISFGMRSHNIGATTKAQIYRNGVAVGTEQTTTAATEQTKTEDIAGWSAGDKLQLYADDNGDTAVYLANLCIYELAPPDYRVLFDQNNP